jgi:RNA polymerase sigma-70 factor, ECF subfamily
MPSFHDAHQAARFTDAYEQYANDILRFCKSKVKDLQEAEDLMQETFFRTWRYMQDGRSIDDLRTFLYRVAENLVIDLSRKKREVSLDELQEQGFDPTHEPIESMQQSMDVETLLASAERKQEFQLLTMRYVKGLRPVDIAHQTGLAPNTVAVRLHRAMRKLMRKFIPTNTKR